MIAVKRLHSLLYPVVVAPNTICEGTTVIAGKWAAICLLMLGTPVFAHAKEDVCGFRSRTAGTVFSMSISRSMSLNNTPVEFKLCERKEPSQSFVLTNVKSAHSQKRSVTRRLVIDETTFVSLVGLYERALEYNVKDEALGNDGSSWCLETTRGFTYSKACFWSPEYNTDERHLTGMLALGRALWHLAEIDDRLY